MLPVDQVAADGMAPMNFLVRGTVGIVLVEQVILALPMDEAVGVIHPVGGRQEVVLGAMRVISQSAS